MHEQNIPTIVVLDLDNTVWYGNYQRHGYLFSEILYRLKNRVDLKTPIHFPYEEFLAGWHIYTAYLHLTAPQQLDLFLDLLIKDGSLLFEDKMQKNYFRRVCVEWLENKYWELVYHPEHLYIAHQSYEYGRIVSLVPGVHDGLSFLRQQKTRRGLKVNALSLNLQHASQAILNMLAVADVFDDVHGVTWNEPSPTKEESLHKILLEHHVNSNQAVTIGDAVSDITAGKSVGVKTVAIATGPTPYSDLLACKPDKILTRWPEKADEIERVFFF